MNAAEAKQYYLKRAPVPGPEWTGPVRKQALERFAALGFPTTHDEEWKYTSVEPLEKIPFAPGLSHDDGVERRVVDLGLEELAPNRLAVINGRFSHRLARLRALPKGVVAMSFAEAMSGHRDLVERHWARYADYRDQAFGALNTALAEDGVFVYVPAGAELPPLQLLFIASAADEPTVSHPRSLIVLERGSRATVIETYFGMKDDVYWTNGVTEIALDDNAVFDGYKLQLESPRGFHIATQQARLGRGAVLSSHAFALGAELARNDVNAAFAGEGGDCTLNGLYVTSGRQHVDNHTRIDHERPRCTSRELYKGIMGGKSRGVFNGKIYVHEHAEKTDARQTNRNLLLSEEAWVDTKPQLEIYNNDVKCSHGSTIGQLEEDALFFLRSRGLDIRAAVGLLTQGFANDITGRVKPERLAELLERRLAEKIDAMVQEKERW
ncbi:MAG TPA: Fe-S cluster assembly protein SufD [Candidatus Binatia bacterium]|nr:Fe-S cluster assembly protein SufD [Candidatus Binatia bacterium]